MRPELKQKRMDIWQRRISHDFIETCMDCNIDPMLITGPSRHPEIHALRMTVARALHDMAWSLPKIGWVMKRDHSSILLMVNMDYRRRKHAYAREAIMERMDTAE